MKSKQALDVSELPTLAFDTRAVPWWGNLLLTLIESMTVALAIASYFYLSQNFEHWPPPNTNRTPAIYDTYPDLFPGTWNVLLLLVSLVPMIAADVLARRFKFVPLLVALAVVTLAGIASLVLRVYEFPALKFRWDDNAYGSIVWALFVLHFSYLVLATLESAIILFWLVLHGIDEKHALDVTLSAIYWYWMVLVGVIIYGVVYWAPHVM